MVARQHYRWDFIGLSTDNKPTPTTSEKVVDGSTFYCSDNSKLYVWYNDQWYEKVVSGGGGGTDNFNALSNRPKYNGTLMTGDTDIPEVVTYTAGDNISIVDGEISATDTTYTDFTGTDGSSTGTAGLVPAPATTDAGKFLKADGTWDTAGGSITPVQTPGASTTDVMSQNAVTSMVFADPGTNAKVRIGSGSNITLGSESISIGHQRDNATIGSESVVIGHLAAGRYAENVIIGHGSSSNNENTVAIGHSATTQTLNANFSVAIGAGARATMQGQFDISTGSDYPTYGYNNSNYRLLSGVYDGQSAHDAATVGQITPTTDSSAPTTATAGRLGEIRIDTSTNTAYMCVLSDSTTPAYEWKQITA